VQRNFRLTRSDEFKRVRQSGKSYAHPLVVLVVQAAELPRMKIGITAGRTVGNAVYRNRAKRLLREAMRPTLKDLPAGWDLILIARPGMASATLDDTRMALASLLRRAGLIPSNES
jgi:ribonuclease P protein component